MEDCFAASSGSPSTRWSARKKQKSTKKRNEAITSEVPSRKHNRLKTRNPSAPPRQLLKQRSSLESCESEDVPLESTTDAVAAAEVEEDRMTNPLIADYEEQGSMSLHQLQRITDGISFHRPDTYSLRYMAQLLGLKNVVKADENGMVSMEQLQRSLSLHELTSQPMKDPIFQVPNEISLPKQAPFWITTPEEERTLLHQETQRIRWLDPFYVQMWSHAPKLVPITTVQHARVMEDLASLPPGDSVLQRVLRTSASLAMDTDPQSVVYVPLEEAQMLPAVANLIATLPTPNGVVSGWVALDKNNSTTVVAVVLYRFEWCAAATNTPMEDAAEMIVHLLGSSVFDHPDVVKESQQVWIRLVLLSLVFEQARMCHVWYALVAAGDDQRFLETYFVMVAPGFEPWTMMIGDLHHHSVRYSFLQYLEIYSADEEQSCWKKAAAGTITTGRHRWLARFPKKADVAKLLPSEGPSEAGPALPSGVTAEVPLPIYEWMNRSKFITSNMKEDGARSFSNPSPAKKAVSIAVSAIFSGDEMTLHRRNPADGTVVAELPIAPFLKEPPSLHLLRDFPFPSTTSTIAKEAAISPILLSLTTKQKELAELEQSLTPTVCRLFSRVLEERVAYESVEATELRERERHILRESRQVLERRREQDLAWQRQLEQDMDAVCEICGDGEVIPDNQILFCEACNVAVHQMCYGIEKVPEGDYYCIPCRRLGRGKRLTGAQQRIPTPLPICCELCPLRQGAFTRTNMKPVKDEPPRDRWVHVLCAKWLGLKHVDENLELVEDVAPMCMDFRRHGIRCELCLGERGCMNRCMHQPHCKKYFHVTCARAVGTMRVVHGENCYGDIQNNGWQLFCPEHSGMAAVDVSKNAISVDALVRAAKEFPPEPAPPPIPKPFPSLTGPERKTRLADFSFEQAVISEVLSKKVGARCEVCDVLDEDYKSWARCVSCNVMFCKCCQVECDDIKGKYKCPSCQYVDKCKKEKLDYEVPCCCTCIQKGGLLRESYAKPAKAKFMKKKRHAYENSIFVKQSWVHELCAIWLPELYLPGDTGVVNLSHVICVSNKFGMINPKWVCVLCGKNSGLKMKCDHSNCNCDIDGVLEKVTMHVTCARQAGFEVRADDARTTSQGNPLCYIRCYRHCSNEYNLRAKLEDLLEIEKKRAGKDYSKADALMTFNDAARLLNSSIQVMRILGWAWRWAEWWVDYNSSWEPLLEPGQKEENMTNEELKKVESTRESRCEDARKCRLAAFGAALRNRLYDVGDGFKDKALGRALRAVLHTQSLVGPLSPYEIDFYVDWLGRAYRSKSRLLYFGDDKNLVSNDHEFCVNPDKSLKHELGERPLPGGQDLPDGVFFESNITDPDNFLQTVVLSDSTPMRASNKRSRSSTRRKQKADSIEENNMDSGVAEGMVPPSPRSTPRSRKSDLPDATDMANAQDDVWSSPKRQRKRPSPFSSWETFESPVKPSPSGKRRGRPPSSAKKSAIPEPPGNMLATNEISIENAMLLTDTSPMESEAMTQELKMVQDAEQSLGPNQGKSADQDDSQKSLDHVESEAPHADSFHSLPEMETAKDTLPELVLAEADLGLSLPVVNTLDGSDKMPGHTNDSVAMAAMAPERSLDEAGHGASEPVASPSRSRVRFRSKLRHHVPAAAAAAEETEHRPTATSPSVDAPVEEEEDTFEAVVQQRQRRPTRPLTYDHPPEPLVRPRRAVATVPTYKDDDEEFEDDDDDLPLAELALKYPSSPKRDPSPRHAARRRDIPAADCELGHAEISDATTTAETTHSIKSPWPRIRGRRRGKMAAAASL